MANMAIKTSLNYKQVACFAKLSLVILFLLGQTGLLGAKDAGADGTNRLGAPSIAMPETASGFVMAGVGMVGKGEQGTGTITLNVPSGATITKALLYWQGNSADSTTTDTSITINGMTADDDVAVAISGTSISGTYYNPHNNFYHTAYRADITTKDIIKPGNKTYTVGGLTRFNFRPKVGAPTANNGIGLLVIYNHPRMGQWPIFVRDGDDFIYRSWCTFTCEYDALYAAKLCIRYNRLCQNIYTDEALDHVCNGTTTTLTFDPADRPRRARLGMFFASVSGSASGGGERPSFINFQFLGDTARTYTPPPDIFGRGCYDPSGDSLETCPTEALRDCWHSTGYSNFKCYNLLDSRDGDEWDTVLTELYLRPKMNQLNITPYSHDIWDYRPNLKMISNGASMDWIATVLMVEPIERTVKPRAVLVQ